jgi:hypothetical protein
MLRKSLSLVGLLVLASLCRTSAGATPPAIRSVDVAGTAFRITYKDGHVLAGTDLQGAVLTLKLSGDARPGRYRLDQIERDPENSDILLYRITVLATQAGEADHDLCEADAHGENRAFPLKGQWDAGGRRLTETGLTLACAAAGAIGKCVRWGYRPWGTTPSGTPLAPYHAACVNMVRANYCGDRGTTRDGMTIDYWDNAGIIRADEEQARALGLRFEAAWSPEGALCVAHTRVPEHMTLKNLARTCPRLRRIGPAECDSDAAQKGRYGKALIFNSSH